MLKGYDCPSAFFDQPFHVGKFLHPLCKCNTGSYDDWSENVCIINDLFDILQIWTEYTGIENFENSDQVSLQHNIQLSGLTTLLSPFHPTAKLTSLKCKSECSL